MFNKIYLYIAIAAIVAGIGAYIKIQSSKIEVLESQKILWESKNKELADRIESQNESLKEAESKFLTTQRELDIANGKNQAVSTQYEKLRKDWWNNKPVPVSCPDSMVELKSVVIDITERWNAK
jgi:hypothetical protein